MLSKLEVRNKKILVEGYTFDPAGSAMTDPIQIIDVKGLDPVNASLNLTPFGTIAGETFTGGSIGRRNIVLTLELNPDYFRGTQTWTLRELLYRYFQPTSELNLVFQRIGLHPVQIDGIVETIEYAHFSDKMQAQVSIICPDPYFRGMQIVTMTNKALNAGQDPFLYLPEFEYTGSVPVGFKMTIKIPDSSPDITDTWVIRSLGPEVQTMILLNYTIKNDRELRLSTVHGDRYVREEVVGLGPIDGVSRLQNLEPESDWPLFYPGTNIFGVHAFTESFLAINAPDVTLSYLPKYGGV